MTPNRSYLLPFVVRDQNLKPTTLQKVYDQCDLISPNF